MTRVAYADGRDGRLDAAAMAIEDRAYQFVDGGCELDQERARDRDDMLTEGSAPNAYIVDRTVA